MRQELEDGVNFISAAHRMGAKFWPQTTRRQQIQALDTVRLAAEMNIGPIRRRLIARKYDGRARLLGLQASAH